MRKFILLLCSLAFAQGVRAQLPALPQASNIVSGAFPNGIRYYLVTNHAEYGVADFALVQNWAPGEKTARRALYETNHFPRNVKSPCDFLKSLGVGYSLDGYVDCGRNSTIYKFGNVPVSNSYAVDSLMMLVFDICGTCPANQAVIISGDISADEIKGKMSIFSMTVPRREKFVPDDSYEWVPMDNLTFIRRVNSNRDASTIKATWSIPRTGKKSLNTIQVYITRMLYGELGIILEERLRDEFRRQEVPLADVETNYVGSEGTEGDESFSISIVVGKNRLEKATEILSRTLASVDRLGAKSLELYYAHDAYVADLKRKTSARTYTNKEYVSLCASSYLYGTDLANLAHEYSFISSKNVSGGKNLDIFNDFASSIIDSEKNLVLEYDTPLSNIDRQELSSLFRTAWAEKEDILRYKPTPVHPVDTLDGKLAPRKVKLRTEVADPLTGGSLWTFSNGLRVIFKQTPSTGKFQYALMVRGGYPAIPGLMEGEGAFVSDVLGLFDFQRMSCTDIGKALRCSGMDFGTEISVSDIRVKGSAPSKEYRKALNTLVLYTNSLHGNKAEFDNYLSEEPLRIDRRHNDDGGIVARMDQAMRPDYLFSQYKYQENLGEDILGRVSYFAKNQFSRLGDGIIVIIGDVDPVNVQDYFKKYGGYFEAESSFMARPQAKYELRSGFEPYVSEAGEGEKEGAYVMNSVIIPVTTERYLAFEVAKGILQRRLSRAVSDLGVYCEVSGDYEMYPQERLTIVTSCHSAARGGLPPDIAPHDPREALARIREVIARSGSTEVPKAEFNALKTSLGKSLKDRLASPEAKIDIVLSRYSEGKDLFTRYEDVLKNLSPDKVRDVLGEIAGGSSVEYILER